jgi:hypothetical protein
MNRRDRDAENGNHGKSLEIIIIDVSRRMVFVCWQHRGQKRERFRVNYSSADVLSGFLCRNPASENAVGLRPADGS